MNKVWMFLSFIALSACNNTGNSGWPEKNLIEYGVPLTIRAPENVDIVRSKIAFQEDVTVKAENYDLQIFVSDAIVNNENDALKAQLVIVKDNPYFSKIMEVDPNGFVFENAIDTANIYYGFRYIKLMGGKEYLFQEGMIGSFTHEQILATYGGVKQD